MNALLYIESQIDTLKNNSPEKFASPSGWNNLFQQTRGAIFVLFEIEVISYEEFISCLNNLDSLDETRNKNN